MGGLIFLSIFTAVGVTICVLILWGTSDDPNEWPALGTNLGQAGFGMVWWRRLWTPRSSQVPSATEAMGPHYDLHTVDHRLEQMRSHPHPHDAPSWMDGPGAFARDGLVDAEDPASHRDEKAG